MYRDIVDYLLSKKRIEDRQEIFNTFFKDIDLLTYEKEINKRQNENDNSLRLKDILIELSSVWINNENAPYTDPLGILETPFDFVRYVVSQRVTISNANVNSITASILYAPTVIKFLSKITECFSNKELMDILHLENVLSYRLYLYIKANLSLQENNEIQISLDDLRTIFGVEDKYPEFRDFRKYILDKAIYDIYKNLDKNIKYSKVLLEQKVSDILFQIES